MFNYFVCHNNTRGVSCRNKYKEGKRCHQPVFLQKRFCQLSLDNFQLQIPHSRHNITP